MISNQCDYLSMQGLSKGQQQDHALHFQFIFHFHDHDLP